MMNRLAAEPSPYLLQHAENPVDWFPWGPEAFERARTQNKPVFLSIGYSTCHWCHVMARESFQDPAVAEKLNRDFIPVKVDREERPDVDSVYMAACMAMTGTGGWPLTVLTTPDQQPFWAGTYLPRQQLLALLDRASKLWREDREGAQKAGERLTDYLRRMDAPRPEAPGRELVARAVDLYAQIFDPVWGGFGSAPKFPSPHNLIFLLRCARLTGDRRGLEMAEKTLEAMYRGGIFDHVGGGFSRYSTDRQWLVPHFEKMLYDNALLALAYTEAYQHTRRPLWREAACRTLDYVLRELTAPEGGFYCGQDADSEGVEGRYYLFTPEELRALLGQEAGETFCRWYGVTERGNFEGGNILNLIGREKPDREPEGLAEMRERVREYRLNRVKLHRDDKVLTAWNGLMMAALAGAGLVLDRPDYLAAAERAADFIQRHLTDGEGRLLARWREGHAAHPGKLEDWAFCAWGLLGLYGVTFRAEYLARAGRLANRLLDQFFDEERGGFYPYASEGEQLITRTKEFYDGAMPSGNSVMGLVLSRLARLTGETRWRRAADRQMACLAGAAAGQEIGHGFALLALLEELWPSAELICAAQRLPEELTDFLREKARPELTVLVKTPETARALEDLAPYTTAYPIPEGAARFYLCRGGACAQPVDSVEEVRAMLGGD